MYPHCKTITSTTTSTRIYYGPDRFGKIVSYLLFIPFICDLILLICFFFIYFRSSSSSRRQVDQKDGHNNNNRTTSISTSIDTSAVAQRQATRAVHQYYQGRFLVVPEIVAAPIATVLKKSTSRNDTRRADYMHPSRRGTWFRHAIGVDWKDSHNNNSNNNDNRTTSTSTYIR